MTMTTKTMKKTKLRLRLLRPRRRRNPKASSNTWSLPRLTKSASTPTKSRSTLPTSAPSPGASSPGPVTTRPPSASKNPTLARRSFNTDIESTKGPFGCRAWIPTEKQSGNQPSLEKSIEILLIVTLLLGNFVYLCVIKL